MELVDVFNSKDVVDLKLIKKLVGKKSLENFTGEKHKVIDAFQTLINYMYEEKLADGFDVGFTSKEGEYIRMSLQITEGKMEKVEEEESIYNVLVDGVKEFRKMYRLTQEKFGKMVEENKTKISRFENGKLNPKLSFLVKIADVIGIEMKVKDDE